MYEILNILENHITGVCSQVDADFSFQSSYALLTAKRRYEYILFLPQ